VRKMADDPEFTGVVSDVGSLDLAAAPGSILNSGIQVFSNLVNP